MTKYIDADKLKAEIERLRKTNIKALDADHITPGVFHGRAQAFNYLFEFITSSQQEQPEVFDTIAFQKGVEEGRRLEREDALTIADIEKLHTFLYAVKNYKHGVFTFTRLTDEQYEEVLRRFNNAKEK